jgi:hypothetical protein
MSKIFPRLLLERCVRAAVAAAIGAISTQLLTGSLGLTSTRTLGIAAGAAAMSAVMSILSQVIGDPNSTSFTKVTVAPTDPSVGQ